jgi:hypothetical protein
MIEALPKGTRFNTRESQLQLFRTAPKQFTALGTTNTNLEPKWKNDFRWAQQDAKNKGLIRHIGPPRSGEWQRI